MDRELTNNVLEGTARAGEVGGDGERDDVRRPEAEMTGTVPAIAGTPARSRCPGRKRRPRRSGEAPPVSSGWRRSAAI